MSRKRGKRSPTRLTRVPPEHEALGRPWRACILRALHPDGSILWPEHNSLEQYRDIYESGGSALFLSIWLQDPSGLAGEVFHPEWIQEFCYPSTTEVQPSAVNPGRDVILTAKELLAEGLVQAILPDIRLLVSLQAHDLAIKQTQTADYYVRCNGYASRTGELFIHDVRQAKLTDLEMVDDMAQAGRRYRARAIGVESVGFQSLMFRTAKREHGRLPFVELDPEGRDKVMRARPLADHCERRKVYLLYGARWSQVVTAQLLSFPGGAHDDIVDAMAYLYEMAGKYALGDFADLSRAQEHIRRAVRTGGLGGLAGLGAGRLDTALGRLSDLGI